ncbi:MAG: mechanosensitive ion channel family protein, partial [Burkholderiaceae bacterium]|nr:mechanosensitive ion channel family protein [Burkholderiaceae bacterium]
MTQDNFLQPIIDAWQSLGGAAASSVRIIGILLAAWVAIAVAQRSIRLLRARIASRLDDREALKRAET